MQALLLDTNALFYYVTQSSRFGKKTISLMDKSKLYFSPLSLVEIKIKTLKGKLKLEPLTTEFLDRIELHSLSFVREAAEHFDLTINDDPFDNMLLAQARHARAKFVTSDMKLLTAGLDFVIDLTE